MLELPIPSARRFWKFGRSLRRAIQNYPKDIKVAIAGTGGLSHQVHGERCGFNNTEWDMEFMDRLEKDPEGLLNIPIAKLAELGGWEGAEIVMWMMMRGALSKDVNLLHKTYFLPSMTPIATLMFEDASSEPVDSESHEDYMKRIMWDYAGAGKLEGTYPFTIERSVKAWKINHFLHSLTDPVHRKVFQSDGEASLAEADLTDEERQLIRELNWIGMIHYGVIFFMLEKLGCRDRRWQYRRLCRDEGPERRGLPEDPQCGDKLFSRRRRRLNIGASGLRRTSAARRPIGRGEREARKLEAR